jgi:hypothetical protein
MKKKISILLCLFFAMPSFLFAQSNLPVKKIHAYKQASLPGILPRLPGDDSNKERAGRKETFNYFIYLEVLKKENITLLSVFLSGKEVKIKPDTITTLPVIKMINTGASVNDTIILIKATKNRVVMITPSGEAKSNLPLSANHTKIIKENELVLFYSWKGKKYYKAVKKMMVLAPEAHV